MGRNQGSEGGRESARGEGQREALAKPSEQCLEREADGKLLGTALCARELTGQFKHRSGVFSQLPENQGAGQRGCSRGADLSAEPPSPP